MTEQEARAEAESWLKRLDGDSHWARSPEQRERIDHERTILSSLLAAPGRNPKCEHGIALSDLCSYAETITNEPERVEAAPSDTDLEALIVRIQREMESYDPETLGDDPAVFDSWNLLHDARAALVASQPVQVEPLWETKPDGSIGPTEHGLKAWDESQPLQVEVTDEMVERAAQAFGGLTTTNWSDAEGWERGAVRGSMRAALSAALGGGDHAE